MENIVKNLHKFNDVLTPEQIDDLEASALMYRRYARIYFKVMSIDTEVKELKIKVHQEKNPSENYIEKRDLNERAKTLFSRYFGGYTIHTHPIPYTAPPAEIVTPEWIRGQMFTHRTSLKHLVNDLGISKSELSLLVNGERPLTIARKSMFLYYFKCKELECGRPRLLRGRCSLS